MLHARPIHLGFMRGARTRGPPYRIAFGIDPAWPGLRVIGFRPIFRIVRIAIQLLEADRIELDRGIAETAAATTATGGLTANKEELAAVRREARPAFVIRIERHLVRRLVLA